MKLAAAFVAVALLTATMSTAFAKGSTVKITIESPELPASIAITDSKIRQFSIWSGPGTFTNDVEHVEGFIIDWSAGTVEAPLGLHTYQVSFYEGCDPSESSACRTTELSLTYVVSYAFNPSTREGFVYLTGGRDEFAALNTSHIYRGHGYEGHWFHATKDWDTFVAPFIARAK
jgi:hypothetical protein